MLKIAHHADGTQHQRHMAGRKKQKLDPKDEAYRLQHRLAITQTSWDLRSIMSPIEDQGQAGTCTAHMRAGLIEANEHANGAKLAAAVTVPTVSVGTVTVATDGTASFNVAVHPAAKPTPTPTPSPTPTHKLIRDCRLLAYYATETLEGTQGTDSGASIRDAVKSAAVYGCADESMYPYSDTLVTTKPPQNVWDAGLLHKISSYHAIADGDLQTIKSVLVSGFPVGFGFEVYSYFMTQQMASQGLLGKPAKTETLEGGHAVVIVGFDDHKAMPDGTTGAVLVRNSWSAQWGLSGYFWMSYAYLTDTALCSDFWVVQSMPLYSTT